MFFGKKDKGETRQFEYQQQFVVGRSGRLRSPRDLDVEAEIHRVLGDILGSVAVGLHRQAEVLKRENQDIIDGEYFDDIVSGS